MPAAETIYTIAPSPDSAIALEIKTSGLGKRKYLFFFEKYTGDLAYDPDDPLASHVRLSIDSTSVVCRDSALKPRSQRKLVRFARDEALNAGDYPLISFVSTAILAKPLRGFVVEGNLEVHGLTRPVRANVVFGARKNHRLQIDADSTLRLTDFAIPRLSSMMGLVRTDDEVLLRILLWGISGGQADNPGRGVASKPGEPNRNL